MSLDYCQARLEIHRYVWVGKLGDATPVTGVNAEAVSCFCLVHRGKALVVVNDTHQITEEGCEWTCESLGDYVQPRARYS
jgi:hypothetical protein